jgi:hypothetical protein
MSGCLWFHGSWNRADLRGLVIRPGAMRPDNQEKKECNGYAGGTEDKWLHPTALRCDGFIQARADAG